MDISEIVPKNNGYLIGHDYALKTLLDAYNKNSLHNSWLISGVEGIGKATLAYKFARFLLNEAESGGKERTTMDIAESSQAFRLVSMGAHPDMKVIERDYTDTEKRKIVKAIKDGESLSESELKDLKKSAFIRVDDVRTIGEFLSKKSSNDGWRVVLIDSIDDMNQASANAVLKVLEEPPYKTVMLLISHNPAKLLPTIKSRCAKLNLKPLEENEVASLLRRYRPDVKEADVKKIAMISSGSIGKAILYVDNDALTRYDSLCKIIYAKNKFNIKDLLSFCESAAKDEEIYELSKELVLKFLSEYAKSSANSIEIMDAWDYTVKTFDETDRLNMDKKQVMVNVINNIAKVI